QRFESPVQGQLLHMLARGLSSDEDAAVILADGEVPDATVGRLADPRLDLFGEGGHRLTSLVMISCWDNLLPSWPVRSDSFRWAPLLSRRWRHVTGSAPHSLLILPVTSRSPST